MRIWPHFLLFAFGLITAPAWAAGDLAYATKVGAGETVIDTRPSEECRRASLHGARCLPPGELLGPQRALPNERDLLWLFGTLGLSGSETVLVAGDTASGRDFVAGLLYLSGQHTVRVLNRPLTPLLTARNDAAPGATRGLVRETVFAAPMRDALWIVHPDELAGIASKEAIVATDAYAAIIRFTRHVASGKPAVRVGWNLSAGTAPQ